MKRIFVLLMMLCGLTAVAQVNTAGLTSQAPADGERFYIVCDNGYFLTTKGASVVATATAPNDPEWMMVHGTGDKWMLRTSGKDYLAWSADGTQPEMKDQAVMWTLNNTTSYRKTACYQMCADDIIEYFGQTMQDFVAIYVMNDGSAVGEWPASYAAPNKDETTYCTDFLFFQTLPEVIDNRATGGDEEDDEEIDIEPNDIESDFPTNWEKGMQDAKVLTLVPMQQSQLHKDEWNPARKGVAKMEFVQFSEDVVKQFYGNRVKNLYFILPPNGRHLNFYIWNAEAKTKSERVLWEKSFDFSATVDKLIAKGAIYDDPDGGGVWLDVAQKDPDDEYYYNGTTVAQERIVQIPCDYVISEKYPNLQIGYTLTYPGDYKENYRNGRDAKGGLLDGYWYNCSYSLPTSRTAYALMKGDDDPDFYDGRYEDYTNHTSVLKKEYQWTDHTGMFCFVETEGNGGFPHNDIRFDDVKSSRCYAGDSKVAFNTTFTNYGVDAIKSATFNVTVGENTQTIRFRDGIRFLEQASLNDDIKAPTEPSRQHLQIKVSKINGKDVDITSNVDCSIIAVNEKEDVDRMPVIEENTGTWCGWCPRGLVGMEMLREKYGENIALIGIHTGQDQKSNYMMDNVVATFGATGAPSCIVNRLYTCDPYGGTSGDYFGIKDDVETARRQITEATIGFDKVVRSKDGKHIGLQTSTVFNIDCDYCPYLLTYVLAEDDLQYAQQMNYYITQIDAATKELYKKEAPELYELTQKPNNWRPVYNDVMQYCAEGLGLEGSLTGAIVKGEAKKHSFAFDIPKYTTGQYLVSDLDNCRLIALLLDAESMEIVNAAQIRMEDAIVSDDDPLITGVGTVLRQQTTDNGRTYDLQGRPAAVSHGAVIVKDGKKVIL